jgi:hypothetical protein
MQIPSILALDINYQMTDENYEKTVSLKLDIDKVKFENLNKDLKENNKKEISLDIVNKLVTTGSVEKNEEGFIFKMNPPKEYAEISELIHPLLQINISYFNKNKTVYLNFSPEFNHLMENQKFSEIIEKYYLPIRRNELKNQLGDHFESVQKEDSKFYNLYHSMLKMPLKQFETAMLPALYNSKESNFFSETEGEFYKYLMYVPEENFLELPKNMVGEIVRADQINFSVRYLNMDEIDETKSQLLNQEEYVNNIGKVLFENTVNLDSEKPFEIDVSTEDLKQNNSIVEKHNYPKFFKTDDGEIGVTRPDVTTQFLLKAYFGINNKFFDKKIKKEEIITINQ